MDILDTNKCKVCGNTTLNKTYCSMRCRDVSRHKKSWVKISCKQCGKEIECRISRIKTFCSNKCSAEFNSKNPSKLNKIKETVFSRYGSTSVFNVPEIIQKIKETNIKRYGVDHFSKSRQFSEKFKNTCNSKYGVDYPQQNGEIRKKTEISFSEKYGGRGWASKEISDKIIKTNLERYNEKNPIHSKEILSKVRETNLQKYGGTSPQCNSEVRQKSLMTLKTKYGDDIENISQVKEIQDSILKERRKLFYERLIRGDRLNNESTPLFSEEDFNGTEFYKKYLFQCKTCSSKFESHLHSGHSPRCPTCYPHIPSQPQQELFEFLQTILPSERIIQNSRSIINPFEIDIFIPSKNLGIEFDGLFYHSELSGNRHKKYHLNKTESCENSGIKLVHVFENEWETKKEIVKQRLSHILGIKMETIYARNCEIRKLNHLDCSQFLEKYHLQGSDQSSIRYGAFYNDQLVSVMTFGKQRLVTGIKNSGILNFELIRFCVGSIPVIGIGSKFLKSFISEYQPESIITFADRRWSSNRPFYEKIGFKLVGSTSPNYWYFNWSDRYILHHRFNFRKDQLSKKIQSFDPNLSEWENMKNNGYDRIWDCGSWKYVWTKS